MSGSSTAYWIKQRFRDEDFKVVIIENNDNFMEGSLKFLDETPFSLNFYFFR